MGLSLSLKPRRFKLVLRKETKPEEEAGSKSGPASNSSVNLSRVSKVTTPVPTATDVPQPQTPPNKVSTTTDEFFSDILNSQAGTDYTYYCNSGYEDWPTDQVPRTNTSESNVPRNASWKISNVFRESTENVPTTQAIEDDDDDEDEEEPVLQAPKSPFADKIASFEKEALKQEIARLSKLKKQRSSKDFKEEPKCTSRYKKAKKAKNNVSRSIFSQITKHFLGNRVSLSSASLSTEELDESELNKSYSKIRFSPIVKVNFFDKTIAPSHLPPIDYTYQASLQTDVHKSTLYTAEEELNAIQQTILRSPASTKNSKKRVLSDSYNMPYQASKKRVCTPFSIPKHQPPKPLLSGTKRLNPNFSQDTTQSNKATGLSFEEFEESLKLHRSKRMTKYKKKQYKYESIAQHYSDLEKNGYIAGGRL